MVVAVTKVVSKNFIQDIIARIHNFFGMNLKGYEKMVDKGFAQIMEELEENEIELAWYRVEISQLTSGALSITLYGDKK